MHNFESFWKTRLNNALTDALYQIGQYTAVNEISYPIFIELSVGKATEVFNTYPRDKLETHNESSAKPLHMHSKFTYKSRVFVSNRELTKYDVEKQ